ncbi:MAG: hypothetical protein HY561_07025, partial [Gemmatimonadetes bacterium]|nr:hypothetical protein [Gemmatimonadota bacterium]
TENVRARADARLEEALMRLGVRDPRDFCRERLRALKERDAAGYERALRYFEETLVPRVAEEASDPLAEWIRYGRLLGELHGGVGRTVAVDASGRARPYGNGDSDDLLVLYLPDDPRAPALVLSAPTGLTPAQQATLDLLVYGKTTV